MVSYRFKRLMFGISCAPELFQKVMESIVAGLEGVVVYLDDLMVSGRTQVEHDDRLAQLMQRIREYGILLNEEKCVFNTPRIEFVGHELSADGIRPMESKMAAIASFRNPENVSELRSFLGLVTYVGRFIPFLAEKTEALRCLLRTGERFDWQDKHSAAFEEIKLAICNSKCLGYYDPNDLCIVIADASPIGLGAILMQQDRSGETRAIAFASKALTVTERKYFQTEKEALALVWAVDKFQLYLLGKKFRLVTDCKPLHFLFKERTKPCARIERWVLRLQTYDYEVVYEPGSHNLADVFSRLAVSKPTEFNATDENCIFQLAMAIVPHAISVQEVLDETTNDETLQKVIESLKTGKWNEQVKEFKVFESELCVVQNLLLRGDKLVIPEALKVRILEIAHESHPGMVAMKRRLRQKVWWPQLDRQVEEFVKKCKACTLVSTANHPEPMTRTKMPEKAWADLAIDFVGPLPSGHNLLVIIDYFSRFIEIIIMKQITATMTIKALHETFCRFGMPETIKTDNGPQFISGELLDYCKQYGIEHRRITPYWPQANGEVERINRSIGKRLKISHETVDSDWQWDLRTFVLMHNSSPHSTTGVAPSSLMFGRTLKDKLPGLMLKGNTVLEEIQDHDHVKKMKEAEYANKQRRARLDDLREGDRVVLRRVQKENKLSTTFDPEEYIVVGRRGPDCELQSTESKRIIHRNVAHLKKLFSTANDETERQEDFSSRTEKNDNRAISGDTTRGTSIDSNKDVGTDESNRASYTTKPFQVKTNDEQSRPRREYKKPSFLKDFEINNV